MITIIMAGGIGKRMESYLPKVLHTVLIPKDINKQKVPMIIHVIKKAEEINSNKIFIIVGKYKDIIISTIKHYINLGFITGINLDYIIQNVPLGTGHAILSTLPYIHNYKKESALILSGDVPLISLETLNNLIDDNNKLLITELDNPEGCGRIIFNNKKINNIVEEKDCSINEKEIKFVNCGIYQIKVNDLINLIPKINNFNKANEYYLTDIIGLMISHNINIDYYILEKNKQYEIKNVNTKKDLEELNNFIETL